MGFSFHTKLINALLLVSLIDLDSGSARSIITSAKFIRDPETVSSNDNAFTLGFFSPQNSTNRYLGIWYLNEANVIWVANRNQPLRNSSGIFTISQDGNLVVLNGNKQVIWSSNVQNIASNSTAQLLDTGNLILQAVNREEIIWESFKHPCDTAVPSFKLITNRITGEKMIGKSWKSPSDPSIGYYSASLERLDAPEVFLWVNGSRPYARSGPWNGRVFIGTTQVVGGYLYGWSVGNEEDGSVYLTYNFGNRSYFGTLSLTSKGKIKLILWSDRKEVLRHEFEVTDCDVYGQCGAWGSCNGESKPICSCLSGFEPRNLEEWNKQNWASGCVRKATLQCDSVKNETEVGKQDGFLKHEKTKVPDFAERSAAKEIEECNTQCLANCSCVAYAFEAGIGCMYWNRSLIDIQKFSDGGVDLYVRVAHSELEIQTEKKKNKTVIAIIAIAISIGTIILAAIAYLSCKYAAKNAGRKHTEHQIQRMTADSKQNKLEELPIYDFRKIASATNNFHSANLLGKGGFGRVYKGELQDGQKIAVKRLSKASGQGIEEFMNEVVVISKLQHRNLVRLLGCCIEGDEKLLIYEFMPNKSLDACLFDPLQQKFLDWEKRINIIEGIARGMLYLHRDSRLRIIHRDLKASNILLDEEMNPKISDFGLARIFKGNEEGGNTTRIVGTYGYMSPEYAMEGHFSERSDVYSFGVLLLEIISGKRNTSFYNNEQSLSLIGLAWKLWKEENIKALIDPHICDPSFENQILRCIHIGLLCVQELASERPSMTTVVSMLNSEIVNLPPLGQVAFVQRRNFLNSENCQEEERPNSANNVTHSEIHGR